MFGCQLFFLLSEKSAYHLEEIVKIALAGC